MPAPTEARRRIIERRIADEMARTSDPVRRKRYQERLDALRKAAGAKDDPEMLSERPYAPYRALTPKEDAVGFEALNDKLNKAEAQMEAEIRKALEQARQQVGSAARSNADDPEAAVGQQVYLRGAVLDAVGGAAKSAYALGKTTAASESGTDRAPTPQGRNSVLRAEITLDAENFVADTEKAVRQAALDAIAAGADEDGVAAYAQSAFDDATDRGIGALKGSVVGQNVNRGRMDQFATVDGIVSYTRSEILDGVTCDVCAEMDGITVAPDDPYLDLDLVHNNCRGLWIPNYSDEDDLPEIDDVPAAIDGRFSKVNGRPIINEYSRKAAPETTGSGPVRRVEFSKMLDADGDPMAKIGDKIPAGDRSYSSGPIDVVKTPDGYVVLDGQHRVNDAMNAGRTSLDANVLSRDAALKKYGRLMPQLEGIL